MQIWKKINDYQDYSVSNHGQIKSDRFNRILKISINGSGYGYVNLISNRVVKTSAVHAIVMENFGTPKPEHNFVIDHIDGNKLNNVYSNLNWVSIQENTIRYYGNQDKKTKILELRKFGLTLSAISKEVGLSLYTVQQTCVR